MSSFVFTGRCSMTPIGWDHVPTRPELHLMCGRNGHVALDHVSLGTDYLVASRDNTTKARKARRLGADIISYSDFFSMMSHTGPNGRLNPVNAPSTRYHDGGNINADGVTTGAQALARAQARVSASARAAQAAKTTLGRQMQLLASLGNMDAEGVEVPEEQAYVVLCRVRSGSDMSNHSSVVYRGRDGSFCDNAGTRNPRLFGIEDATRYDTFNEAAAEVNRINRSIAADGDMWIEMASVVAVSLNQQQRQCDPPVVAPPEPPQFQARRRVLNIAGE